jgi:hypothetical protein
VRKHYSEHRELAERLADLRENWPEKTGFMLSALAAGALVEEWKERNLLLARAANVIRQHAKEGCVNCLRVGRDLGARRG